MRKQWLVFIVMLLASVALWGCGSSRDSSGITTSSDTDFGSDPVSGQAFVGASTCIGCHEDFSWSTDAVANYLAGKHVIHSDHINAASESVCLTCHDPIGDGGTLESLIDAANVPAEGLAAVGCENCHGAGGQHYGVGPIPKARPAADTCGQCHDDQWDTIPEAASHINYHPEGNAIFTDYSASPHAASGDRNEPKCVKCHTDEGGRTYKDVETATALEAALPVEGTASAIQCRTCHDPHSDRFYQEERVPHFWVKATVSEVCLTCHVPR